MRHRPRIRNLRNWLNRTLDIFVTFPPTPDDLAYVESRITLRWLSAHVAIKSWIVGGKKWSLLLLKDERNVSTLDATEAAERLKAGMD